MPWRSAYRAIAVAGQTLIYRRIGFTRILGSAHVLWVPMFAWMATRIEAVRVLRGEWAPRYRW